MDPIEIKTKKKSKCWKKIEIKRIEKEENRQVCFSKRRLGIFKKANELCTLCGAEVAIVVFSLAGKPYSFGHPSVDHVLRRFLNVVPTPSVTFPATTNCSEPMNQELVYLQEKLEAEIKRRGALEEALKTPWPVPKSFWWGSDLQSMGIEELREYGKVLLEYQTIVAQAAQQICFQATEAAMGQLDGQPAEYGKVLLEYQTMVAQAAQQIFFQANEAAMGQIDAQPAEPKGGEADYFLWLEQQQDLGFAGYDYNYGA